jgi:hypothetical protein
LNKKKKDFNRHFQDVVVMGAALEKVFYEKLAEMPADVREIILVFRGSWNPF